MAQNKLPPELHDAILGQVAAGKSTREIAGWLKSHHAISVTHAAVANLIRKHRGARAETVKTALVEYAAKKLPADLQHADSQYDRVARLLDRAIDEAEQDLSTFAVDKVAKLSKVVREATEERRKALGLDQPESPAITSLFDLLSGEDNDDATTEPN